MGGGEMGGFPAATRVGAGAGGREIGMCPCYGPGRSTPGKWMETWGSPPRMV